MALVVQRACDRTGTGGYRRALVQGLPRQRTGWPLWVSGRRAADLVAVRVGPSGPASRRGYLCHGTVPPFHLFDDTIALDSDFAALSEQFPERGGFPIR